jgi:hypothetical protein
LLFYALSPTPCFSCQASATGTNTQLRTQTKQNKALAPKIIFRKVAY